LNRVGEFSWGPDRDSIVCPVHGSAAYPYQVTLEKAEDGLYLASGYCTCPYSDDWSLCKHTYAALKRLEQRLTDEDDPLRTQLFGNPGAKPGAPDWETMLVELDSFLEQHQSGGDEASDRDHRLVWRVRVDEAYEELTVQIAPYRQKRSKTNGNWTRGRKISWQNFCYEDSLMGSAVDREIGALAEAAFSPYNYGRYYGRHEAPDKMAVFEKLIGHPHVYWDDSPSQRIDVRRAQIGLTVVHEDGDLKLIMSIDGQPANAEYPTAVLKEGAARGFIVFEQPHSIIRVAPLDDAGMELLLRLSQFNTAIPKEHQNELLNRLPEIESILPIKLPDELAGETLDADRRTVLRLSPLEEGGVGVELKVRPASEGAVHTPGQGSKKLAGTEAGERFIVQRDLEDEVARANAVAAALALTHFPELTSWQWEIPDDELALDLITAAEAYCEEHADELLVEWPEGAKLSVGGEVTAGALKVEITDRKDWFGLSGTIEIDGEQIQLAALLDAVRQGRRYVTIGKHKWARIAEAFRNRLGALDNVVHANRSGLQLDATAAPALAEFFDDEVPLKASRKWRGLVQRLDAAADEAPAVPPTLAAELRDYQLDGYRWLRRLSDWGMGGCLADDMGLGKTVQSLAVLLDRAERGPALVVAPTSVGFNWIREAQRFAPTLRATLYRETDRGEFLTTLGPGDLVVISYGLVQRDAEQLAEVDWGTLVLDEAQKVKNSQTKTAQAVRSLNADWRLALTGTPIENHLGELWSLFRAISPGLFGSWDRFRERFAEPIERRQDADRRHALSHTVRPFVLRRTKGEVLDELPPRTEVNRRTELSPAEKKLYEAVRLKTVAQLAGLEQGKNGRDGRFEVLAALTKLRQLACHPKLVDDGWKKSSAKLDLLLEIVEELIDGNHRALVFSQFTQHLDLIRAALDERSIEYRYLDGKTTAKRRAAEVDAFQRGEGQLFLISLKAGGTGLNLTAADYVIHMDPWWNPAVEDQATDRAHRIGQNRPVTVYRLVAQDTIEEKILALHEDKRNLVAGVLDGTDKAGKLSTQELIALIRDDSPPAATTVPAPKRRAKRKKKTAARR
jgi:hypothetical protein